MKRKRVPLNAIRAFEATARHGSVARAAEELGVTPTAVSHQLRQFEEFLQTRLFERKGGRIDLSVEAAATVGRLSAALDRIDEAMTRLMPGAAPRPGLSVAVSASVGQLWLMPRLRDFMVAEPGIDIDMRSFVTRRAAEESEAELRIYNWRSVTDMRVEPLLEEEIVPVASPALAAEYGRDALASAPLIHVDRRADGPEGAYPDWARYLRDFGISRGDVGRGVRFNQAGTAIDAARAGLGVLLGRSILIETALDRGELVELGEAHPIRSPYFLLSPWRPAEARALERFRGWLFDIARPRGVHAA